MIDDTIAGQCCEDVTVSHRCEMQRVRSGGFMCLNSAVAGVTFLKNRQRHVRCCKRFYIVFDFTN